MYFLYKFIQYIWFINYKTYRTVTCLFKNRFNRTGLLLGKSINIVCTPVWTKTKRRKNKCKFLNSVTKKQQLITKINEQITRWTNRKVFITGFEVTWQIMWLGWTSHALLVFPNNTDLWKKFTPTEYKTDTCAIQKQQKCLKMWLSVPENAKHF